MRAPCSSRVCTAPERPPSRRRSRIYSSTAVAPTPCSTYIRQSLTGELDKVGRARRKLRCDPGVDLHPGRHAGPLLEVCRKLPDSLVELVVRQDPGTESKDVVAKIADHSVDLVHSAFDATLHVGIPAQGPCGLQSHPDREQRLDHPVVELLGD